MDHIETEQLSSSALHHLKPKNKKSKNIDTLRLKTKERQQIKTNLHWGQYLLSHEAASLLQSQLNLPSYPSRSTIQGEINKHIKGEMTRHESNTIINRQITLSKEQEGTRTDLVFKHFHN